MTTKHIKAAIAAISIVLLLSGCSTPFMKDRKNDALDIFTLAGGYGGGAKVRVGPVNVGALWNRDTCGWKGGYYQPYGSDDKWSKELTTPVPIYLGYDKGFKSGEEKYDPTAFYRPNLREKDFSTTHKAVYSVVHNKRWFYYSQIEVALAIGPSVRIGFNPGELLDYLLGFAWLDIYNDDVEDR